MLNSTDVQVRLADRMLNITIRKTDNLRRSFPGLHFSAGSSKHSTEALLSMCPAVQVKAFHYVSNTLIIFQLNVKWKKE